VYGVRMGRVAQMIGVGLAVAGLLGALIAATATYGVPLVIAGIAFAVLGALIAIGGTVARSR
jgi:hypothetical protein